MLFGNTDHALMKGHAPLQPATWTEVKEVLGSCPAHTQIVLVTGEGDVAARWAEGIFTGDVRSLDDGHPDPDSLATVAMGLSVEQAVELQPRLGPNVRLIRVSDGEAKFGYDIGKADAWRSISDTIVTQDAFTSALLAPALLAVCPDSGITSLAGALWPTVMSFGSWGRRTAVCLDPYLDSDAGPFLLLDLPPGRILDVGQRLADHSAAGHLFLGAHQTVDAQQMPTAWHSITVTYAIPRF